MEILTRSIKAAALGAALMGVGFALPAAAADLLSPQPAASEPVLTEPALNDSHFDIPYVDELRFGAYYTNPDQAERGAVLQGEVIFSQFLPYEFDNKFLNALLLPRIHVGGNLNVTGDTSAAYTGLTWQLPIYGPLFIEGTFGGAVHNGELDNAPPDRQQLGCPIAFRESGSIGLAFDKWTILGTVEHMSNAGWCSENDGLTNFGMRVGYKF
ncbi:MAG: acyloxyacyl hydrolase [Pseudomonadota bacterium]